ncbi:MAG: 50S ribosomal protein L1 [Candidatus Berkelbacteria bacterium]|nr:50S ribosomal protein L1 [Candidatus Berkelbacteria bacterium]
MAKKNKTDEKSLEIESEHEDTLDELEREGETEIDQKIDLETAEKETDTGEVVAAEVAAIHADTEVAKEPKKKTSENVRVPKAVKSKLKTAPKKRSKSYLKSIESLDKSVTYPVDEAIKLIKSTSYSKFDGTVSLSVRLEKSKKSAEDTARGVIKLPYGTGKKLKVAVADEEIIEKIKKGWADFDILVASPQIMPKLAQVAKILGPKGKMPNPKDGTVAEDPKSAAQELSENIVRYRTDLGRNIHIPVGKVSWNDDKLAENIKAVLKGLSHLKKTNFALSPTMGPGVKVAP